MCSLSHPDICNSLPGVAVKLSALSFWGSLLAHFRPLPTDPLNATLTTSAEAVAWLESYAVRYCIYKLEIAPTGRWHAYVTVGGDELARHLASSDTVLGLVQQIIAQLRFDRWLRLEK